MNKILIRNGLIEKKINDYYEVINNKIYFKKNGTYYVEYLDDMNINIEFIVEDNTDILLVETSFNNNINVNNQYTIYGKIVVNKFYSNKNVYEKININLMRENAKIEYYFSNICLFEENYQININHLCKNTNSIISNKAVALNNSKINYEINSNVSKDMNGSVLDQATRIITFGECDAKVLPNMYIDLEDVIAKHGSVIGTIKDEMIFYLMSRGINYNEALKLIIKGYLLSHGMYDYDIRRKVLKTIDMYWR